jgi:hypothetical protein
MGTYKGKDIKTMLKDVLQKYPDEIPFVAKVPEKKMLIMSYRFKEVIWQYFAFSF